MTRPMTKSATARDRRRTLVGVWSCLWWKKQPHASLFSLKYLEIVCEGASEIVPVLEMGDGDDNQQVKGHSQKRNDR